MIDKAALAKLAVKAGKAAYRKDRENRYALLEPWPLPPLMRDLPRYEGPHIQFLPLGDGRTSVVVLPYGGDTCDGASLAPDWPRGAVPAALIHDPLYAEIPAIASTWRWSEDRVRRLADEIFGAVMARWRYDTARTRLGRALARSRYSVAGLYYTGVRRLGGIFRLLSHRLPPALLLCAAVLLMSGCSGCLDPPRDLLDPDVPLPPPQYEKTA